MLGCLQQSRNRLHDFIFGIEHRLFDEFLVLHLGLVMLDTHFFDLGLQLGDVIHQLFLISHVLAKDHLFLPKFFVDLSHRVYLTLSILELDEDLLDITPLSNILISQLLQECLELDILFVIPLVLLFEISILQSKLFELS